MPALLLSSPEQLLFLFFRRRFCDAFLAIPKEYLNPRTKWGTIQVPESVSGGQSQHPDLKTNYERHEPTDENIHNFPERKDRRPSKCRSTFRDGIGRARSGGVGPHCSHLCCAESGPLLSLLWTGTGAGC